MSAVALEAPRPLGLTSSVSLLTYTQSRHLSVPDQP
jgi:hypothetical protein